MRYYFAKMTQSSDTDLSVTEFHNGYLGAITWAVTSNVNEIMGTCPVNTFNVDMPPHWAIADASGSKYAITPVSATQILIQCYDKDGNAKANILNGNEIYFQQG